MNLDDARRFLAALRRGDRKAIEALRARHASLARLECRECGRPILPRYDFEEMVLEGECPECGRSVRRPIQEWSRNGPLQPPPAS